MIAYLKAAETDHYLLTKEILNNKNYNDSEQNIQPANKLEKDQLYSIETLINQMIIYSDNLAYSLLLENIDNTQVYKVYQDLDVDISKAQDNPSGNIISVKDYASFFRILYNSSYLNKEMSEKALYILSQSDYKNALVEGIPNQITVAHKFGERHFLETGESQLHDCGIVYNQKKPYLICIMTRGKDLTKLSQGISKISKIIFDNVNLQ